MLWSIVNGEKKLATPNEIGECPLCKGKTISRCGSINKWHWSHKTKKDCDLWYEPETEWHINWKNKFPKKNQEIIIGKHRADIISNNGVIIELQNSPISSDDIINRENFYVKLVWLFNGKNFAKNMELRKNENYFTFRWYHPQKSLWFCKKPIYIDFESKIFCIRKLYSNLPCGGWGFFVSEKEFLEKYV